MGVPSRQNFDEAKVEPLHRSAINIFYTELSSSGQIAWHPDRTIRRARAGDTAFDLGVPYWKLLKVQYGFRFGHLDEASDAVEIRRDLTH